MTFFEKFEALANRKGKSLRAVALELGFDPSLAAQWKRRGGQPRVELVHKIASYFRVPPDVLLDDGKELQLLPIYDTAEADALSAEIREDTGTVAEELARVLALLASVQDRVARLQKRVEQDNDATTQRALEKVKKFHEQKSERGAAGGRAG